MKGNFVATSFHRERESFYYYNGVQLPLNSDDAYKCIPKLVERMADEFFAALEFHSKVLAVRLDLHCHTDEATNAPIKGLWNWLKQDLKRLYRMNNVGCFWVREHGKKKGVHWHLVLLLDGNKTQDSHLVIKKISAYWERLKNLGDVKIPHNCYKQMIRGDADSFDEAFYRSSYLTKERSKFVCNNRSYGCSQLASKLKKRTITNSTSP